MNIHTPTKENSQKDRRLSTVSNASYSSLLTVLTIRTDRSEEEEEEAASPIQTPTTCAIITPITKHADPNKIDVIAYQGAQLNTVRTYNQVHCNCGRQIQYRADVRINQPRVDPEIISISSGTPAATNITISSTEEDPAIVIDSTSSSGDMQISDIEPESNNQIRNPRVDEWVQQS